MLGHNKTSNFESGRILTWQFAWRHFTGGVISLRALLVKSSLAGGVNLFGDTRVGVPCLFLILVWLCCAGVFTCFAIEFLRSPVILIF